jgi:hypothetical protein
LSIDNPINSFPVLIYVKLFEVFGKDFMTSARESSGWTKENSLAIKPGAVLTKALRIEAKRLGLSQSKLASLIIGNWYGMYPAITKKEDRESILKEAGQL